MTWEIFTPGFSASKSAMILSNHALSSARQCQNSIEPRGARSALAGFKLDALSFTFVQTRRPAEFLAQTSEVEKVPVDSPSLVHLAPRVSPAAKPPEIGRTVTDAANAPASSKRNAFALLLTFILSPYSRGGESFDYHSVSGMASRSAILRTSGRISRHETTV